MKTMKTKTNGIGRRALGAIDLAIDLATLGEYGLVPLPADGPYRERPGRKAGWEALPTARPRGSCGSPRVGRAHRSAALSR